MNHSIAVLLTVFNRKDYTLRCLQQLYEQQLSEEISCDIFITDGGSNDGTVEAVRKQFPNANIQVKDGVFWNRGMFASWEMATSKQQYDFYLWLNDDTFLYKDCIKELLAASTAKGDDAIIVGVTVDTATRQQITYGGRDKDGKVVPINGNLTEVLHFNGNIVLIPALVHKVLGNLDYYYCHSKGDFDYAIRAHKTGIKIYQVGKALGECDNHPQIDTWCDPQVPLRKRWEMMHRPNGMPPKEIFHLEKQENTKKAIIHFFTIYLRCLFPQIWTLKFTDHEK